MANMPNNVNTRHHWLLWWRIEPEELQRQVREYDSLSKIKTTRGSSTLLLILSGIASVIGFYVSSEPRPESLSDTAVLFGLAVLSGGVCFVLAVFVYQGHRWAMMCSMIYWTLEKAYQIISTPKYAFGSIIWWTVYMQFFYMAYLVEKQRRKTAQPLSLSAAKDDTPRSRGEAGPIP
jgi:hypothetical protein